MVGEVAGSSSLPEALVSYLMETPIAAQVVVFLSAHLISIVGREYFN